jgi:thiol:disulfide interchange protein DsbG
VQADVVRLTQGKASARLLFPGPKGLTGVVLDGPKGPVIGWVTNDLSAFVVGGVIDAKTNENLTMSATQQYIVNAQTQGLGAAVSPNGVAAAASVPSVTPPLPASPESGAATTNVPSAQKSSAADASERGAQALRAFMANPNVPLSLREPGLTGKKVLYAFIDPNCINCHTLIKMIRGMHAQLNAAGVTVQWVPVAILGPSSLTKAAEMLERGYPAVQENEDKFNEAAESGGLSGKVPPGKAPALEARVQELTQELARLTLANKVGADQNGQVAVGTPTLVWQSGPGQPFILAGVPSPAMMDDILKSFSPDWKPPKPAKP